MEWEYTVPVFFKAAFQVVWWNEVRQEGFGKQEPCHTAASPADLAGGSRTVRRPGNWLGKSSGDPRTRSSGIMVAE
ncbi:hypothetical protein EV2_048178 [Malus domestica]